MGRNRNRAPKYVYLSKTQYLHMNNIPKQSPMQSIPSEIDPFHHSTIITMNPFSKEKGLLLDRRVIVNKENMDDNMMENENINKNYLKEDDNNEDFDVLNEIHYHNEKAIVIENDKIQKKPEIIEKKPEILQNFKILEKNADKNTNTSKTQKPVKNIEISITSRDHIKVPEIVITPVEKKTIATQYSLTKPTESDVYYNRTQQKSPNKVISNQEKPINLNINLKSPLNKSPTNQKSPSNFSQKSPLLSSHEKKFENISKIEKKKLLLLNREYFSKSFDFSQPTMPKSPKSPSKFSPTHKAINLKEIEKSSAELPEKIEPLYKYKQNFNKKFMDSPKSDFEMKAEALQLGDILIKEKEKYELLDNDYQISKTNEEELQRQILAYKSTFEDFTDGMNEVKTMQEDLGKEIMRFQELEKIYENMRELELETQEILKENENKMMINEDFFEDKQKLIDKCRILEIEINEMKENQENQEIFQNKLIENVKLLEEEIKEVRNGHGNLISHKEEAPRAMAGNENFKRIYISPLKSKSPGKGYSDSPWDKSRLLNVLEDFFESKVRNFNILLEKPL